MPIPTVTGRLMPLAVASAALMLSFPGTQVRPLAAGADVPRVVESVDLSKYAGRWYEVARFPNRFQQKCASDVRARYHLREDGRLDVVNECRTLQGKIDQAEGIGRKAGDGNNSARLQIRFAPGLFSFLSRTWGDYWIIGLGPEYTWSVVGTPNRDYLWILSRTPAMSAPGYERALEIAKGNGFDTGRLVRTTQSDR